MILGPPIQDHEDDRSPRFIVGRRPQTKKQVRPVPTRLRAYNASSCLEALVGHAGSPALGATPFSRRLSLAGPRRTRSATQRFDAGNNRDCLEQSLSKPQAANKFDVACTDWKFRGAASANPPTEAWSATSGEPLRVSQIRITADRT